MNLVVNIVPSESSGWIIGRIIEELANRNGWGVGPYSSVADINYFVNYRATRGTDFSAQRSRSFTAGWFTHPESAEFFSVARQLDLRICHAERYAKVIDGHTVTPGIDPLFKPKVRLGWVGRTYSSGRKGEEMLQAVQSLPFVEVVRPLPLERTKNEKNYLLKLNEFYSSLDALLITSTVEGGPVPAAEATACGVPVIAPSDVGNLERLAPIFYDKESFEALRAVIKKIHNVKLERSNLVSDWTWFQFAYQNLRLLESGYEKTVKSSVAAVEGQSN